MEATETPIYPGAVIAGKLKVVRLLGEGGMGAVYEVEHSITKHHRALKLLHKEMTQIPGVVARFLREASAAGRIGSPHIVETFDAGQLETGEPYIVMEMLSGRPLDSLLEEKGRLDFGEAVEILKQACIGVQAAHDAGIVHRDLKPENLFLVGGKNLFVKLLDFGISKFDPSRTGDHQLTMEGTALGTPFYMPPEQVRGLADLDARADVYALGVVLYECLTGNKPYIAETLPHLAVLIHEGKYQTISALRPETPQDLERVVDRAMAVNRDHRFPTVRELHDALSAVDLSVSVTHAATMIAPSAIALGTPAAAISPTTSGVAAVTSAAAGTGTTAGTVATSATATTAPSARVWWIVAAAIAIIAVVALVVFGQREEAEATPAENGPATTPAAVQAAAPAATMSAPAVLPVVTQAPPVVTAPTATSPAATAAATTPALSPTSAQAAPTVKKPKAAASSRASQAGLAEENPF